MLEAVENVRNLGTHVSNLGADLRNVRVLIPPSPVEGQRNHGDPERKGAEASGTNKQER